MVDNDMFERTGSGKVVKAISPNEVGDVPVQQADGSKKMQRPPQWASASVHAEAGIAAPPSVGQIRWNNATQASATEFFISDTDSDGVNQAGLYNNLIVGDSLYFQKQTTTGHYQNWGITQIDNQSGYTRFVATLSASNGGNFATAGDGDKLIATVLRGGAVIADQQSLLNTIPGSPTTLTPAMSDLVLFYKAVTGVPGLMSIADIFQSADQSIVTAEADMAKYATLNAGHWELSGGGNFLFTVPSFEFVNKIKIMDDGCYTFRATCTLAIYSYNDTADFFVNDAGATAFSLFLIDITFSTPNATTLGFTAGATVFTARCSFFACEKVATFDTLGFLTLHFTAAIACAAGIFATDVGDGTISAYQWTGAVAASGAAGLTLDGASSGEFTMTEVKSSPIATEGYLDVKAGYGGSVGVTSGFQNKTSGGGFFLAGSRDHTDVDILVTGVKNGPVSQYGASMHFTGNGTPTLIGVAGTPVIILGTYVQVGASRFTTDAAGRFIYTGEEDINIGSSVIATVNPSGGGTKTVSGYIALNGNVVTTSKGESATSSGEQVGAVASFPITKGDYVEAFIANDDDTTTLTVTTLTFSVGV